MAGYQSLKGYVPALARLLELTPDALYERQRSLARVGAIEAGSRGRGHGVRTTASSVAFLMLSILASDSLSESEARVGHLARLKPINPKPFSSWSTFLNALTAILSGSGVADGILEIEVSRTSDRAIIRYYDASGDPAACGFGRARTAEPGIRKSVILAQDLLLKVAEDVQAIINADATEE